VDIQRLLQLLDCVSVRERPQILHVDDDPSVLEAVAQALGTTANVTSVGSIGDARAALVARHFDLAVLDIKLGAVSGLDLLPDLRGSKGRAIPVIIFSAHDANSVRDAQVQASLSKSKDALANLVAAVHDRLMPRYAAASKEAV
jgi:DNA-binding response OmpR family regulator